MCTAPFEPSGGHPAHTRAFALPLVLLGEDHVILFLFHPKTPHYELNNLTAPLATDSQHGLQ